MLGNKGKGARQDGDRESQKALCTQETMKWDNTVLADLHWIDSKSTFECGDTVIIVVERNKGLYVTVPHGHLQKQQWDSEGARSTMACRWGQCQGHPTCCCNLTYTDRSRKLRSSAHW